MNKRQNATRYRVLLLAALFMLTAGFGCDTQAPSNGCDGGNGAGATNTNTNTTTNTNTSTTTNTNTGWDTNYGPYTNPVIWEDLADNEVIRVDDTFYYTASTMHYSPGAPVLRSYDLVNWEYAGHSVPVLDWSSKYDLNGGNAYIKGIWASTLQYRRSNKKFYWMGCIEFSKTYVYTASSVEGPWQKHSPINNCYYDAGLLIDDNDKMYVAYGNKSLSVAELSADGFSQVRAQQVYTSNVTLEGARFYKVKGNYYIVVTRPPDAEFVLRASNPFGPYTIRPLVDRVGSPVSGAGAPHQGSLVETQNGEWYYMAFIDAYPGGRVPVLAPVNWSSDGWPSVQLVNGKWGASYPHPDVPPHPAVKPRTGIDRFEGNKLGAEWEWNHNPDNSKWSVNNGLVLQTATVTRDLYAARNTLTRRILGPQSTATIELDYSQMADGDQAGLALLRQSSAWVGVRRSGGATSVVMTRDLAMDSNWKTTSTGTQAASTTVSGGRIWLRATANIRPGSGRQGHFSYSTNGVNFMPIGSGFTLNNTWQFFMGYRFGIFNFATQRLGGRATVKSFELSAP